MLFASWLRSLAPYSGIRRARRGSRSVRLKVTRLEPRRVLNASPLIPAQDPGFGAIDATATAQADDLATVIDAGSFADDGAADTFHVYRSGEGIGVSVDGHEVFSGRIDGPHGLIIQGSSDADRFVLHFGAGDLPAAKITFDGGSQPAGGNDIIELRGAADEVAHVLHPGGNGASSADATSITYRDVEQLHDAVNAAVRTVQLSQIETAELQGTSDGRLRLETGELRLDMHRPTERFELDFIGGSGTDLDIGDLGRDLRFDVAVQGDSHDHISVGGTAGFTDGAFSVRAGEIDIHGSIQSRGADLTFEAESRATLFSDGTLDSDGGFVELSAGKDGTL
ncbi:MAG: hypothetical protein M3552_16765, partial [Planctomycetota bacterium]|nr:hypothetical protein [Planctomycetota bacterium]